MLLDAAQRPSLPVHRLTTSTRHSYQPGCLSPTVGRVPHLAGCPESSTKLTAVMTMAAMTPTFLRAVAHVVERTNTSETSPILAAYHPLTLTVSTGIPYTRPLRLASNKRSS